MGFLENTLGAFIGVGHLLCRIMANMVCLILGNGFLNVTIISYLRRRNMSCPTTGSSPQRGDVREDLIGCCYCRQALSESYPPGSLSKLWFHFVLPGKIVERTLEKKEGKSFTQSNYKTMKYHLKSCPAEAPVSIHLAVAGIFSLGLLCKILKGPVTVLTLMAQSGWSDFCFHMWLYELYGKISMGDSEWCESPALFCHCQHKKTLRMYREWCWKCILPPCLLS